MQRDYNYPNNNKQSGESLYRTKVALDFSFYFSGDVLALDFEGDMIKLPLMADIGDADDKVDT